MNTGDTNAYLAPEKSSDALLSVQELLVFLVQQSNLGGRNFGLHESNKREKNF
jgi:hypothetical protein